MDIQKQRNQIDQIDNQIIDLIDKRFFLTDEIGKIKKDNNIEILNNKREDYIYKKIQTKSNYFEEVKEVYTKIMEISKKRQKR